MPESNAINQIYEVLQNINGKLDQLLPEYKNNDERSVTDVMDVMTLLSLPDHLRTSATAIFELGYATASGVAKTTHKKRAVESGYLNQLVRLGHVNKYREGRKVYFSINERPDNHEHTS
jgi:hypothetical protein